MPDSLKEIKEGYRNRIECLVKEAALKTGTNGEYMNLVLADKEGNSLSANYFFKARVPAEEFRGKVCELIIVINSKGYVNIAGISVIPDADISEYIRKAPIDIDLEFEKIRSFFTEANDHEDVRKVVLYLLENNKDDFKKWSAAKSVHHNYYGGLLYHTCRMFRMADAYSTVYGLDTTMLKAGIAVHDIGKLRELRTDDAGTADYSVEGNLFGHLLIGIEMIDHACMVLAVDTMQEDIMLLKHMIAAHHGTLEQGAIVQPATKEAWALHLIDLTDSRMEICDEELKSVEPGTYSQRIRWLDGAVLYKASNQ